MLICLMSLRNQVVYIQFHPVAYMVKLNIELSMAQLITKIARSSIDSRNHEFMAQSSSAHRTATAPIGLRSGVNGKERSKSADLGGIKVNKQVDVRIEEREVDMNMQADVEIGADRPDPMVWRESSSESERVPVGGQAFDARSELAGRTRSEDQLPLAPPSAPLKTSGTVQKKGEGW